MSKPLSGKIALVTGGSRGIGRGIAIELAEAGATVYVTGRRPAESGRNTVPSANTLEGTVKEINSKGGKAIAVHVDHAQPEEIEKLFQKIAKDQDGRLDILVNNAYAGLAHIFQHGDKNFYEIPGRPEDSWDIVNNVGLRATYIASFYAAKLMVPRKSGVIINISSSGGLSYLFDVTYGVGKAGADRMAADMGIELAPKNVTVLAFWPGPVNTELVKQAKDSGALGEDSVFNKTESVHYAGRVIVHLLKSPNLHALTGQIVMGPVVGAANKINDIDGSPKPWSGMDEIKPFVEQLNAVRLQTLKK